MRSKLLHIAPDFKCSPKNVILLDDNVYSQLLHSRFEVLDCLLSTRHLADQLPPLLSRLINLFSIGSHFLNTHHFRLFLVQLYDFVVNLSEAGGGVASKLFVSQFQTNQSLCSR